MTTQYCNYCGTELEYNTMNDHYELHLIEHRKKLKEEKNCETNQTML